MDKAGFTGYSKRAKALGPDYAQAIHVCEVCGGECEYDVLGVQIVCDICWNEHPEERSGKGPLYRIKVPRGSFTGRVRRMKRIPPVDYVPQLGTIPEVPKVRRPRARTREQVTAPRSHAQCNHPRTAAARRACRKGL